MMENEQETFMLKTDQISKKKKMCCIYSNCVYFIFTNCQHCLKCYFLWTQPLYVLFGHPCYLPFHVLIHLLFHLKMAREISQRGFINEKCFNFLVILYPVQCLDVNIIKLIPHPWLLKLVKIVLQLLKIPSNAYSKVNIVFLWNKVISELLKRNLFHDCKIHAWRRVWLISL